MSFDFRYTDKYGSFTLSKRKRVALASFSGSLGERLTAKFADHLKEIGDTFDGTPWAYLSVSPNIEASTAEGAQNIVKAIKTAINQGCVVDAYVLGTEISKAQTRDIRIASGIQTPLEDVLFTTIEDANQSIESRLNYVLEQVKLARA